MGVCDERAHFQIFRLLQSLAIIELNSIYVRRIANRMDLTKLPQDPYLTPTFLVVARKLQSELRMGSGFFPATGTKIRLAQPAEAKPLTTASFRRCLSDSLFD